MKRYIIISKIRFLVLMSIIMIIAVSSVFSLGVSAKESSEISLKAEYVEEGDTIWSMAVKHAGDMEIREYISRVMDINDLSTANIMPGDLLYFPEYN